VNKKAGLSANQKNFITSDKVALTAWPAHKTSRTLPQEAPIALTYDRVTFAVMMASPADLEDYAIGFSLAEGIITSPSDILELSIAQLPAGIECRMALTASRRAALETRRRRIAGPAGCGLCGMDSLAEAIRAPRVVTCTLTVTPQQITAVMARLPELQTLNGQTHGVHAAAFYTPADGVILVREDIGRHSALDKLIGALVRQNAQAASGVLLLTSRVSIELIQKAAIAGIGIIAAVSVPSLRAVRDADAAGITLIAIARGDGFEVFSHADRIKPL
jgi:FdhD protein